MCCQKFVQNEQKMSSFLHFMIERGIISYFQKQEQLCLAWWPSVAMLRCDTMFKQKLMASLEFQILDVCQTIYIIDLMYAAEIWLLFRSFKEFPRYLKEFPRPPLGFQQTDLLAEGGQEGRASTRIVLLFTRGQINFAQLLWPNDFCKLFFWVQLQFHFTRGQIDLAKRFSFLFLAETSKEVRYILLFFSEYDTKLSTHFVCGYIYVAVCFGPKKL